MYGTSIEGLEGSGNWCVRVCTPATATQSPACLAHTVKGSPVSASPASLEEVTPDRSRLLTPTMISERRYTERGHDLGAETPLCSTRRSEPRPLFVPLAPVAYFLLAQLARQVRCSV